MSLYSCVSNHSYAKPFEENALDHFFISAENDPLVVNKWFALQVGAQAVSPQPSRLYMYIIFWWFSVSAK